MATAPRPVTIEMVMQPGQKAAQKRVQFIDSFEKHKIFYVALEVILTFCFVIRLGTECENLKPTNFERTREFGICDILSWRRELYINL